MLMLSQNASILVPFKGVYVTVKKDTDGKVIRGDVREWQTDTILGSYTTYDRALIVVRNIMNTLAEGPGVIQLELGTRIDLGERIYEMPQK